MSTTTLLPCPFCGREARISHSRDGELCNIRCAGWNPGDCLGAGPNCYSVDEAVAGWNRRGVAAAPVVLPEPVGWRHSRTLTLHETEQEVQLADGDSHAEPLFTEEQLRALLATATGLPAQAVEPHPDDVAVDALAALMKAKLAKQRDKGYGGWDTDCTQQRLSERLRDHVEKGDPVDVANFCAFLSARGEGIATHAQADARDAARWRESLSHVYSATKGNGQPIFGISLSPSESLYRSKLTSADQYTKDIDAAIAAAKGE